MRKFLLLIMVMGLLASCHTSQPANTPLPWKVVQIDTKTNSFYAVYRGKYVRRFTPITPDVKKGEIVYHSWSTEEASNKEIGANQ